MGKVIVKYEIEDFEQYTNKDLIEKMEMYLGKMQLIEFSNEKESYHKIKKWFNCSLNMYNITKVLDKRIKLNEAINKSSLN